MKLGAAAGILGLALAAPAPVMADTVTVPVQAIVTGVCIFQTSSPTATLTIANSGGNIDPSLATPATGTMSLSYKCTKSATAPTFTMGSGGNLTLNGPSGATMAATMTVTGGGAPLGFAAAAQTATLTGTILPAVYGAAIAGTYSNNETVTITP
jgi:hypothetical protein